MSPLFAPFLSRRALLGVAGASFASAAIPRWASAAGSRDPRLVVVVLRGALDGLCAVAPIGDPDYSDLLRDLALQWGGDHPALRLGDFFGLNPAMTNFSRLYDAKQAMIVHATATTVPTAVSFTSTASMSGGKVRSGIAISAANSGKAKPAGAWARRSNAATTPSFDLRNVRSKNAKRKR